jgi:hypothetical protein
MLLLLPSFSVLLLSTHDIDFRLVFPRLLFPSGCNFLLFLASFFKIAPVSDPFVGSVVSGPALVEIVIFDQLRSIEERTYT